MRSAARHIKINAVTPGYTATDLNNFQGDRSTEEGARASVLLATSGDTTGGFFNDEGPLPRRA